MFSVLPLAEEGVACLSDYKHFHTEKSKLGALFAHPPLYPITCTDSHIGNTKNIYRAKLSDVRKHRIEHTGVWCATTCIGKVVSLLFWVMHQHRCTSSFIACSLECTWVCVCMSWGLGWLGGQVNKTGFKYTQVLFF